MKVIDGSVVGVVPYDRESSGSVTGRNEHRLHASERAMDSSSLSLSLHRSLSCPVRRRIRQPLIPLGIARNNTVTELGNRLGEEETGTTGRDQYLRTWLLGTTDLVLG